ncbi:MAG: Ig-like domain-containing protein, partial [Bifidobacteriaceae bacterium]|nr:Ig-like domain-containing protein [Bifidobacteriaceae bacterium]
SFEVDQSVKRADGKANALARMKAQDRYGNPVAGVALSFQLAYAGTQGPLFGDAHTGAKDSSSLSGPDGWVRASVYSVWPGDFDVRGAYQASAGVTRQVHFSNAPASAAKSWFKVEPKAGNAAFPKAAADGRDAYTVTVTLCGADGLPLNAAGATVRLSPDGIPGAQAQDYPVVSGGAGDGLAQVDVTTLRAGAWEVTVLIGQDRLGTSAGGAVKAVPVEFVAGPPAAARSRLMAPQAPAKADGKEQASARAEVFDANGNAVAGASVVFAVPSGVQALDRSGNLVAGPAQVAIQTSQAAGREGQAVLVLTSTTVGSYPVTAKVGGDEIKQGAPALAVFVNADLSPSRSEFDVPSMPPAKVAGTGYHTPRVTLKDASGNVYTPVVPVTFYYKLQSAAVWTQGPTVDTSAGVARWDTFTVTRAGVYDVRANVPQGQIPDAATTRPVEFVAGPPDPARSQFWASNGKVAPGTGDTHTARVTVLDSHGNPVAGAAVDFSLAGGDPANFATPACAARTCTVLSSATGAAQVEVNASATATTRVTGAIGGVAVGAADLIFAAGAPDPLKSSWAITPAGPVTADGAQAYTATVRVLDGQGVPVDGGVVDFDVPGAVAVSPAGPYAADSKGVVTVKFTSQTAGGYTVNAKIGAAKIGPADQVVSFAAGAISEAPDRTFLTAPPSAALADGAKTQVVTATVRDAHGNPVTGALVRFAVPVGTSAVGAAEQPVDANGQARLTLTSTAAGAYEVTAEARVGASGQWIQIKGGSPAKVAFEAGPVSVTASHISKTEPGPKTADGLDEYTLLVELKDQHSNPVKVAGTAVVFVFRLYDQSGQPVPGVPEVTRSAATGADGVASTTFATAKAGLWQATASVGGSGIVGGSPVPVEFVAGAASAGLSLFAVTSANVLADGQSKHRATVTALDANGNPVAGQEVVFDIDQGAPGVPGPDLAPKDGRVKTGPDGVAYVDIVSHEPGSFPVGAQINGGAVQGSPRPVSFDAGAPDATQSAYQLAPDTAASPTVEVTASGQPGDAYTLAVRVRSAAGIDVPNAHVRLAGLDTSKVSIVEPDGPAGVTGDPRSSAYGSYTWHLYSATAAAFTGKVQVEAAPGDWRDVGAQFTLRFASGTASALDSWLIAPVGPVEANGSDTSEVRAHVRDPQGNDVKAGAVVFAVPAGVTAHVGGQATPGGAGVTVTAPGAAGYASAAYTSTGAGTYTVVATVGGADITQVKDAQEQAQIAGDGKVTVVFTPGQAVAGTSQLTVPTAANGAVKVADAVQKHRAEVLAKDAHGNPVPGAQVMFRYGPDPTRLTERTVPAGPDGVAAVEFASAQAAVYLVQALVAGDPALGSPAEAAFVAGPLDPDKTLASFEVQQSVALASGRHPLWARMLAQDAHGNPVKGVSLGFKITAAGDGPVFAPLASGLKETSGLSGADGLVTVQLVSEFEGAFPVVGVLGADQTAAQTAKFGNDAAAPAKSWFSVQRSASNQGNPATADGKDSYLVTVNLRSADGDPVNGLPAVVIVTDPSTGQATQNTVVSGRVSGASGTAEFRVTSAKSGTFSVTVEVGGDKLAVPAAGAPDQAADVVFLAGAASAATSYLVGPQTGPAKADGNEQQVVQAHARDAQGNPVTTGSATFEIPAGVTAVDLPGGVPVPGPAPLPVPLGAGGVAEVAFTSLTTGNYTVTAKVGATAVTKDSPATLVFANADVSAAESKFTLPSGPGAKTVRREFHTPKAELFDSSGNLYTAAPVDVTFRWRLQGAAPWEGSRVVQSAAGTAFWPSWTVSRAGVYEVEAWIASGQVGATLLAQFKADAAVPSAAVFTSSAGTRVPNDPSASHYAQVLVLDAATGGNVVAGEPVVFTVDGDAKIAGAPGAGQSFTVDSSALGVSRVQITDVKIGGETVTVTATVQGTIVGTAKLEFGPGAPWAGKSTWTVEPTTAISPAHPAVTADGADSWRAAVTLRDALGNPVPGAEVVFAPSAGVRVVEAGPRLADGAGVATATFVSTQAGPHSVRALVGADAILPDPAQIVFAAGPVDGRASYLEAPAGTAVADGNDKLTVAAHVLDAQGNPHSGASVRFALPQGVDAAGAAPGAAEIEVMADASGRAEVTLTSVKAQAYQITAQATPAGAAAWTAIEQGSPAAAVFQAGAVDAGASRISRTPPHPLTVGAAGAGYAVKVELLDAHGNAVKQAMTPVQYRFFLAEPKGDPAAYCRQTPDADTQSASALTDADGVATVPFLSTKAGPWHGCAFYAGDQIVGGSPVPVAFTANAPDPASSRLEVSQNLVLADGNAAHYAKVWVRDAFGNPLAGEDVEFSIDPGAAAVPGPNVKGGTATSATQATCDPAAASPAAYCLAGGAFQTGLAYVEFTSEEPGTFQVQARAAGGTAAGSPAEVSFVSGPADAAKSAWSIVPDTADPKDGDKVTVP